MSRRFLFIFVRLNQAKLFVMVPSKGVKRQQCDQEQYELTTFRTFKKFEIRTFSMSSRHAIGLMSNWDPML